MTGSRILDLLKARQLYPLKYVYYSTMTRATETFQQIEPFLPKNLRPDNIVGSDLIQEGAPFPPEPPAHNWLVNEEDFRVDGARIEKAFQEYIHRAGSEETKPYSSLFVCHGNVIRYFLMRALQFDRAAWLRLSLYNGSITIIDISQDGTVSVRAVGDTGHFKPEMITYG